MHINIGYKKLFFFPLQIPFNTNIKELLQYSFFPSYNKNIILKNRKKKLIVSLLKNTKFYLILNGSPKSFKKLLPGEGIFVDNFSNLEIGLFYRVLKGNIKLRVIINEYDKFLKKINSISLINNSINEINLLKDTKFILLILDFEGEGLIEINNLIFNVTKRDYIFANEDLSSLLEENKKLKEEKELFSRKAYKLNKTLELLNKKIENVGGIFPEILHEALYKYALSLNKSNGVFYYKKIPLKIGIITDEYMYNFYKDAFEEVIYLSPDNYKEILKNKNLDYIFYVTCWKGLNDEEWRGIKFRDKPKKAFEEIISIAKKLDIPLVFQSIEDPSNFEYFLPIAKYFDYIFTSDINMIEKYKKELGHENVFYGEYGFNPLINNPISAFRKSIDGYFFAGSYTKRYEERCKDMEIIFDSILPYNKNLVIADRNFAVKDENLRYPKKYAQNVIPPYKHDILQQIHKLFKFNLNFNSIKYSPTMCAMRVYELQAQASYLISNYAFSVLNKFPNISLIVEKMNMSYFDKMDNLYLKKIKIDSLRKVMNNKASFDILSGFIKKINKNFNYEIKRKIAVLYRGQLKDNVKKSFDNQTYKDKILIEENEFVKKFNNYKDHIDFYTWFDSNNEYEKNYLNDMINVFKYTDVNYVTKNSFFKNDDYLEDKEHEYTNIIKGIEKTIFRVDKVDPKGLIDKKYEEEFLLENGYSSDPFELNYLKYREITNVKPQSYKISVIVPVYNNGEFLKYKCIGSLLRNKLFKEMEIILVDDGSTDDFTVNTCIELSREFSNIKTYFFNDGGSGSASRPRNKGIELSTAEWITFLDPDNEISAGGYDNLYNLVNKIKSNENIDIDFISGFNIKVDENGVKSVAKHTEKEYSIVSDFLNNYFKKGKFPTIATQAALIKKNFIVKNNIKFVEKAAGQDTLFGWELLLNAKIGAFTSKAFLIYYAQREGSVTNTINKEYFEKKLILEKAQKELLEKFSLLNIYKQYHFDKFMKEWYIKKFEILSNDEKNDVKEILNTICEIYNKKLSSYIKY